MDRTTVLALNALNRRFYDQSAEAFDATRREAWPGWERVLGHLDPGRAPSVLDVGCGNGRLGRFLAERLSVPPSYTGIDSCEALLRRAREALVAGANVRLLCADPIAEPGALPRGPFDLIALFGFLHHVPGRATRRDLLEQLADRLAPGGLLALARWRLDCERIQAKVVPWDQLAQAGVPASERPDPGELEPGDVLLGWGPERRPLRYCHFVDDAEERELLAGLPLRCIDRFDADGNLNRYVVSQARPRSGRAASQRRAKFR